jgi:hypothetical protein
MTTTPQITMEDWQGRHNVSDYVSRLEKSQLYRDQSTVCVVPTRGMIHAKIVQNWMGLMTPMNQKFTRIFVIGLEVGEAYNQAINSILDNPELSKWRYVFCLEEDNSVPPDCLLKLIQAMGEGDYAAIGALYWTKGEAGAPMCYGSPTAVPINFIPQIPKPGTLTECNGLGMGATLFRIDKLKEMRSKIEGPLFKTVQVYEPSKGCQCYTQDLWHFQKGRELGFRYACDARVLVGHYDAGSDITW